MLTLQNKLCSSRTTLRVFVDKPYMETERWTILPVSMCHQHLCEHRQMNPMVECNSCLDICCSWEQSATGFRGPARREQIWITCSPSVLITARETNSITLPAWAVTNSPPKTQGKQSNDCTTPPTHSPMTQFNPSSVKLTREFLLWQRD